MAQSRGMRRAFRGMTVARWMGLWLVALGFAALTHVTPLPAGAGGLEVRHAPMAQAATAHLTALVAKPVAPEGKARDPSAILPDAAPISPKPVAAGLRLWPRAGPGGGRAPRPGIQARAPPMLC